MTADHVAAVATLLGRRVGLRMDPALRARLERVVIAASAHVEGGIEAYVRQLERNPGGLQEVIDALTVQVSSFFRDAAQFSALELLLPEFPAPVVIWSAGCAHGEEPYTIAMVLRESERRGRIIATDVSTRAVERARAGRYSAAEMRGVPMARRSGAFRREGAQWQVLPELQSMVTVRQHNLFTDPDPSPPGQCSAIFCRNVLIYMDRREVITVLEKFARSLHPDGYLFLGFSESLLQVTDTFRLVQVGGAFIYQRADRPSRRARAVPTPERAQPSPSVPTPSFPPIDELLAAGEAAITRGDHESAIWALRRAIYLDPNHTIAHVQLGIALEMAGAIPAARRAFLAARSSLALRDTARVEVQLEGYGVDQLDQFLRIKLGAP